MAARRQECGICMDSLKNPKLISCHHSFCYKCLEDYVRVNIRNGRFDCPICRTNVKLPKGSMPVFERNFNIDTDSGEKFVCDLCGPKSVACSRCVDCEETLCQSCCYVHEKLKVSRHHKVIDLGNLNSEMKGKIRQRIFCDQHSEEEIKLFCTDCKVLICFLCEAVNHKTHATKTVADAATEVKKTLQAKINSCLDKLRRVNAAKEKGEELDRNIDDAEREELKSVEDHRSHLNHIIDQEVAKVKVKIKNVYDNLRQQNTVFKRDVQEEFKRCSNANDNAQMLTDQGTDIEIIKKGPHIEQSISEAISKTDQTPNTRLKNKLFSPAEIKQSVVISLIGIMQDSTDSACYTNQSSMRLSSYQMTQPQLDQGLGTTPSQQIMFMPLHQYISTGAQVIQPMDKMQEGSSEHVGLQQKPKAVDSSIKTELSSASLSLARFKAVPLKTRMREGSHEPHPVHAASTPTKIKSSAKELKKDPGSKTKAQYMNRKREIIQGSEMEAFMDLPTEAETSTAVEEKEKQDPTEGTKTLDKVGTIERTTMPPILNEAVVPTVHVKTEDVDNSDASLAVENEKNEKQKLKYKYKDDQWSPINHKGKKQYDSDFLLQLQNAPESTLKPLDLPDIPDIILEKPSLQPVNRDFADGSNFVDFTPRYVWSSGPSRSGGVPRRASGQRGRGGLGGRASQTKHINLSIQKDIELHHAKEAWKPMHRNDKIDQVEVDTKREPSLPPVNSGFADGSNYVDFTPRYVWSGGPCWDKVQEGSTEHIGLQQQPKVDSSIKTGLPTASLSHAGSKAVSITVSVESTLKTRTTEEPASEIKTPVVAKQKDMNCVQRDVTLERKPEKHVQHVKLTAEKTPAVAEQKDTSTVPRDVTLERKPEKHVQHVKLTAEKTPAVAEQKDTSTVPRDVTLERKPEKHVQHVKLTAEKTPAVAEQKDIRSVPRDVILKRKPEKQAQLGKPITAEEHTVLSEVERNESRPEISFKVRMQEMAHEPQPVHAASTPTTIKSSVGAQEADPQSTPYTGFSVPPSYQYPNIQSQFVPQYGYPNAPNLNKQAYTAPRMPTGGNPSQATMYQNSTSIRQAYFSQPSMRPSSYQMSQPQPGQRLYTQPQIMFMPPPQYSSTAPQVIMPMTATNYTQRMPSPAYQNSMPTTQQGLFQVQQQNTANFAHTHTHTHTYNNPPAVFYNQQVQQQNRPPSASGTSGPGQQPTKKRERTVLQIIDHNSGKDIIQELQQARSTTPSSGTLGLHSTPVSGQETSHTEQNEIAAQFAAQVAQVALTTRQVANQQRTMADDTPPQQPSLVDVLATHQQSPPPMGRVDNLSSVITNSSESTVANIQ